MLLKQLELFFILSMNTFYHTKHLSFKVFLLHYGDLFSMRMLLANDAILTVGIKASVEGPLLI